MVRRRRRPGRYLQHNTKNIVNNRQMLHHLHQLKGTDSRNTQHTSVVVYSLPPSQLVRYVPKSPLLGVRMVVLVLFFFVFHSLLSLFGFDAQVSTCEAYAM